MKMEQNLNSDNKRYALGKKKQTVGGDQELSNKLVVQGIHTLSGDNVHQVGGTANIIPEGTLGALVNSHINEGLGNLSSCNESFEN